jgi:hypothetical protein
MKLSVLLQIYATLVKQETFAMYLKPIFEVRNKTNITNILLYLKRVWPCIF